MKIKVNGVEEVLQVTPETTLGELLRQLREFLVQHNQVLSQVVLDGDMLTEEREGQFSDTRVDVFDLLEVKTSQVSDVVRNILSGFLDSIKPLKERSTSIGSLLQQGKRTEALEGLQKLADDLTVFSEGLNYSSRALESTGLNTDNLFENDLKEFQSLLSRVFECLQSDEEVEFADILNFELPENLEKWRSVLQKISSQLVSQQNEEKTSSGGN